jgi:predicted permease
MNPENAPWSFSYPTVGRLAEGVAPEQAAAQLTPVVERIRDSYPEGTSWRSLVTDGQYAPMVERMKEQMVRPLRRPLWILLGTVGFVLLIACTNVANLVLVRSEERQRQTAVRAALGASRGALVGQSLTESTLIGLLAGGMGLMMTWMALPGILAHAPPRLPRLEEVAIDQTVLLFTLGITALSILTFGVAPLIRISSPALFRSLKQGGERTTSGPGRGRYRNLLVATQAALALILMVGSGLMARSFLQVYRTDLGFDYEDLLTFRISAPQSRYGTGEEVTVFHEEILGRLRSLPGVESAALTNVMPLAGGTPTSPFLVEGHSAQEDRAGIMVAYKRVSEGYIETMGIPLLVGNTLEGGDTRNANHRVLVNEAFASSYWPGEDPVGKRLVFPAGRQDREEYFVSGVVGTVMEEGVMEAPEPLVYFPLMNPDEAIGWSVPAGTYVLRGRALPHITRTVHEAVWSVDPEIPLVRLQTGEEIVGESIVQLSSTMVTLGIAAVLALILGVVGLFGVLSYSVAQRTREIAVHMAMGARRGEVMGMVVRDGAKITLLGTVLGLTGAWGLTRILQGLLYGVEALDPLTFGGMAALLMGVALLAAYLPARKAASVDPAESMRAE